MFWSIINLFFALLEILVMWGCLYCFMGSNSRSLFLSKRWYVLSFLAVTALHLVIMLTLSSGWGSVLFQFFMTALLGFLLFHRKPLAIILDILFSVLLFLGMEGGIFCFNLLLAHVPALSFPNLAAAGSAIMALNICILLLLTAAMIFWRRRHEEGPLSLRQTLTVLVLPAFSVFFLYSLLQSLTVYTQLYGVGLLLANIIALLLLNIYFLYLFRYLFRARRLEQEMTIIQLQNQLQYHHYEEIERKYRESRKIIHDMKNHLQAVEQLYKSENTQAADNYVQDLYHLLNILGEKYYSTHHMLNIILNEKLSQAASAGIRVKAEVGDVPFDDIKDMDITAIFANLLDNAIEAAGAESVPPDSQADLTSTNPACENTNPACENNGGSAWLELKIDRVQDFRIIRIRNSIRRPAVSTGTHHMGLGLVNVRHALAGYHGTMEQTETEKEYCVSIMLPGCDAISPAPAADS